MLPIIVPICNWSRIGIAETQMGPINLMTLAQSQAHDPTCIGYWVGSNGGSLTGRPRWHAIWWVRVEMAKIQSQDHNHPLFIHLTWTILLHSLFASHQVQIYNNLTQMILTRGPSHDRPIDWFYFIFLERAHWLIKIQKIPKYCIITHGASFQLEHSNEILAGPCDESNIQSSN